MKIARVTSFIRNYFFMLPQMAQAEQQAAAAGSIGLLHLRASRKLLAVAEAAGHLSEGSLGVIAVLREGLISVVMGIALRERVAIGGDDIGEFWRSASQVSEVQLALGSLSSATRAELDELIGFGVSKNLVERSPGELAAFAATLATIVRQLVERTESEVFAVRRLRYRRALRWVGAALGCIAIASYGVHRIRDAFKARPTNTGTTNVALNKSVKASGNWRQDVYPPSRLTDGDVTQLGCHTERQLNPWVVIDLDDEYMIHRIVVTNRLDGSTSMAIPLRIELSSDGDAYTEYATKEDDFQAWTATGPQREARYVRLTALKETILHLNEVEVY